MHLRQDFMRKNWHFRRLSQIGGKFYFNQLLTTCLQNSKVQISTFILRMFILRLLFYHFMPGVTTQTVEIFFIVSLYTSEMTRNYLFLL